MTQDTVMETELCGNCKRQVPAENYQLHIAHCLRNIQLCPLCEETVPRREEKEHFEEYHAEINCVQCGEITTRIEKGNHVANECGKRPIPCQYCEISLPRERMTEHEEYCGSRTEWCPKCSRYALIKDLQVHQKSCYGASRNAVLPCEFCGASITDDRLNAHQRHCMAGRQDLLVEGKDGLFREIEGATQNGANDDEGKETGIRANNVNFAIFIARESTELFFLWDHFLG